MFVDTHAHLFYDNFKGELDQIIQNAQDNLVDYILVPGTDLKTSKEAIELSKKYESVYAAVGVHPHDTKEWDSKNIDMLEEMANQDKVVAIGEIGLDYYYDFSPKEKQIEAFNQQLELATRLNLPVIIHNREANDDVMNIIRSFKDTKLKAQFHCFAGTAQDAKELIRLGHFISFPGNVTFKNAEETRKVLAGIELENLLLETDSPFMTPVPHRGKRNEPAHVKLIADKFAEIKHLTVEDIGRTTSYNAYRLFNIGVEPKLHFTYKIGNSLYINVTNRCNSDCVFCDRKGEAVISGYKLKMQKSEEPTSEVYIDEIGDPREYNEIVFCGYGEPTIRWEVVKKIADYVKANGGKTRLNTDGHGNFINKRDITPELKGRIDTVSISLNSVDPEQYADLMRVSTKMHGEMLKFASKAKEFTRVVLSIVGIEEVDTQKAKELVENLGVEFRERGFF